MSKNSPENFLKPSKEAFASDPFGYSAIVWEKWAMVQTLSGFPVDPNIRPTSDNLKSPVLWLCQARAMSDAAVAVLRADPQFDLLPELMKGICDSQYRAVGLMLVGYSLEICLKGMIIIRAGVQNYAANEKKYKQHRLVELSSFIPDLSVKDKAILEALTHFVYWAGRYPDPGSGREDDLEKIFRLAETHQIAAKDLFELAGRVMTYAQTVTQ
jgi:hypothetical protein